jgi:pimeloyl-ACP methyl ester carboxylesterase
MQDYNGYDRWHPFRSAKAKETFQAAYDEFSKKWPVTSECRVVDTSFGQTFVRVSGPTNAPPLVLLHGFGATSLSWQPNVEDWSAHYRIYAVDNIYDYGLSVYARPIKTRYEMLTWLDELFNALGLENNINMIGMSYGGWLAGQYTLHYPHRLNKTVLLAPASTVLPVRFEPLIRRIFGVFGLLAPAAAMIPVRLESLIWGYFSFLLPHRYCIKNTFYRLFEDAVHKDDAGRELVEDMIQITYVAQRTFKSKLPVFPNVLTDKELQSIQVPILYMVGENDKIYSGSKAIRRLEKEAPHIQTALIARSGHGLPMSLAPLVNRMVLAFLNN